MSLRRIDTVDELCAYLQTALQLEHSTIPPYMTALYSIVPGTNVAAAETIHMVLVEEMLHLLLVANVLNALGARPDFSAEGFVPRYPAHLPDGETDFEVSVRPFSPEAVATFLRIERPEPPASNRSDDVRACSITSMLPSLCSTSSDDMHFYSIGEFYMEIERGLRWLHEDHTRRGTTLFVGDPSRQVTSSFRYGGGGSVIAVDDLDSALAAIDLICAQGEGLGGSIYDDEGELSHYYRFEQILLGRYYQRGDSAGHPSGADFPVDWHAVYPIKIDARLEDYPEGTPERTRAETFQRAYAAFLSRLTESLGGRPDLLDDVVDEMFTLKTLALDLVRAPIPGQHGTHGAPVFTASP